MKICNVLVIFANGPHIFLGAITKNTFLEELHLQMYLMADK